MSELRGPAGNGSAMAADAGRADRHRLVARIAGDIGHELKNPIHASVINLELVRKRIADGQREDALDRLEIVSEQVRRVHGVVEGLLKLLRESKPGPVHSELDALVEVVLPLLRAQANSAAVPFEWVPAGSGVVCGVSPDALGHVLVGMVAIAVSLARGQGEAGIRVEGAGSPAGVRVSVVGDDESASPGRVADPDLVALVERVAGAADLPLHQDAPAGGVSWSGTVVLEDGPDA